MCIYIYIEKTNYILRINYILCMAMYILRCVCVCVCVSLAPNIVIEMLSLVQDFLSLETSLLCTLAFLSVWSLSFSTLLTFLCFTYN